MSPLRNLEAFMAALLLTASCDKAGNSTAFIEFLLAALLAALREAAGTDQFGDQVTHQVAALLRVLGHETLTALKSMKRLKFHGSSEGPLVTPSLLSF